MDKRKIYIAGKISGMENEAYYLFAKAENHLIRIGWEAINPMDLRHNHDKTWTSYMKECIKALCDCDSIYLLKNWKQSAGAKIEFQIAVQLGFEIIQEL